MFLGSWILNSLWEGCLRVNIENKFKSLKTWKLWPIWLTCKRCLIVRITVFGKWTVTSTKQNERRKSMKLLSPFWYSHILLTLKNLQYTEVIILMLQNIIFNSCRVVVNFYPFLPFWWRSKITTKNHFCLHHKTIVNRANILNYPFSK